MLESFKKGQGVVVRRVAFWASAILILWGGISLYNWLVASFQFSRTLLLGGEGSYLEAPKIPVLDQRLDVAFVMTWVLIIGSVWALHRLLNRPRSADFLIETDSELKKVTWPSWNEAWSSAKVVVAFVIILTGFLFVADFVLQFLIRQILG